MTNVSPSHLSRTDLLPIGEAAPISVTQNVMNPDLNFIRTEIMRLGALPSELHSVRAFLASDISADPRAYDALPPRMRRLVDLATVDAHALTAMICDSDKELTL